MNNIELEKMIHDSADETRRMIDAAVAAVAEKYERRTIRLTKENEDIRKRLRALEGRSFEEEKRAKLQDKLQSMWRTANEVEIDIRNDDGGVVGHVRKVDPGHDVVVFAVSVDGVQRNIFVPHRIARTFRNVEIVTNPEKTVSPRPYMCFDASRCVYEDYSEIEHYAMITGILHRVGINCFPKILITDHDCTDNTRVVVNLLELDIVANDPRTSAIDCPQKRGQPELPQPIPSDRGADWMKSLPRAGSEFSVQTLFEPSKVTVFKVDETIQELTATPNPIPMILEKLDRLVIGVNTNPPGTYR